MLPAELRALPYIVHTNRELGLMLAGKKPLAHFMDGKDRFPDVVVRYLRLFDRQVAAGQMVRRDHIVTVGSPDRPYVSHRILFALPGEEWRMQSMIDLMADDGPWTPAHERREGELLGYENWMNDYWYEYCQRKKAIS